MKISFLLPNVGIYGSVRRIIELSNHLVMRGHEVTVFHPGGLSCPWLPAQARFADTEAILDESHDALIHCDAIWEHHLLTRSANAKVKAFYLLGMAELKLDAVKRQLLGRPRSKSMRVLKRSWGAGFLLLTNATWMHEWLLRECKVENTLLLGGVNHEMFRPVKIVKPEGKIVVVGTGDTRPRKGFVDVQRAVQIARQSDLRITLETLYYKSIPQMKMAEAYNQGHLFADGHRHAGWCNPVAEAMACGVPVVCTDIGGVRDFAVHERTALVVPRQNPQAMAKAILRLASTPRLRARLAKNALRRVRTFTWQDSAKRLEEILGERL